ncbi:MAG TPA: GMC family oxidoreductase N-terminal domain-containing protein [Ramlibacter sp.]|jgi:choline dehydrogenase-like flavoprotein/alpha-beta hydrolase superfamily lysophospholipase|nr:GMC family oxidoreductase N-terminal domain-containing protein [Ramlibacter sp.]
MDAGARSPQSLRRLSRDYTHLLAQPARVWDVLIVGSGYGGAMAAYELATCQDAQGKDIDVCVLERGREYAPGMFPSRLEELPAHVRVHRTSSDEAVGRAEALLDVRVGPDVSAIVGNGLGGGSLINAGVMEEPQFDQCRLPACLAPALASGALAQVKDALGANDGLRATPLRKRAALEALADRAGLPFRHAQITVQTGAGTPEQPACTLCGDCMTGCNVGAKKSLDTTLLRQAREAGVEIFTGCSVLRVQRADDHWEVETVYTNESVRLRHGPAWIKAKKVILAAGTLGSTEILLRSRCDALRFSDTLGTRFSCNGDNLVALHDGPREVHATDDEHRPLHRREVGPTITGVVELEGALLQEFAVPAPLKRFFEETVTTTNLLHGLTERPGPGLDGRDSMAVDPRKMERTLLLGVIGHDEAAGRIVLGHTDMDPRHRHIEGRVGIDWDGVRTSPLMDYTWRQANAVFRDAAEGATVLPNPLWRPLPASVDTLVAGKRGPVLTVHPLGGCAIGESVRDGVVDVLGRVFDAAPGAKDPFHEGLLILDGSILPGSLGANPALTISAIARHAVRTLVDTHWNWTRSGTRAVALPARPVLREAKDCTPSRPPVPTEAEIMERLAGAVGDWWVELTLCFEPVAIADLTTRAQRELRLDPGRSFLRVFEGGSAARCEIMTLRESERDQRAVHIAQISGSMALTEPGGGVAVAHALRAGSAWLTNRGTRELWDRWALGERKGTGLTLQRFLNSAARAGEMRCFDYRLEVGKALKETRPALAAQLAKACVFSGSKRLTYASKCNPWRQLTEMKLQGFPGTPSALLKVDGRFMARQGVPLMRITKQENQVVALAEFASLGLAWLRTLASVHTWSFRAPDPAPAWTPQLKPGPVAGLPQPKVHALQFDVHPPLEPAQVLLTNFAHPGCPPVALIHGYSASGNTFTHPAIPEPLARHLWHAGHDVWVIDLRTSAALPTAKLPWRFEDAAFVDIPAAVAHIRTLTGRRVDVLAHCIGAVQLSMALLADDAMLQRWEQTGGSAPWRQAAECEAKLRHLPDNLHRIVLSQKGPLLAYSDDNVLRAYFMRALRRAILPQDFQFHSPAQQTAGGSLMDRLLSTLPYPDDEFLLENPFLPPWQRATWAGFRHRMDALYARDFSLANIAPTTLAAIEDLFGPLHLDTVAQAIHFARLNTITDAAGEPFDTSPARLGQRWPTDGTLGIHGVENCLVDVHSLHVMKQQMDFAGVPFREKPVPGYGHQDCLIGRNAARDVFPAIREFLA